MAVGFNRNQVLRHNGDIVADQCLRSVVDDTDAEGARQPHAAGSERAGHGDSQHVVACRDHDVLRRRTRKDLIDPRIVADRGGRVGGDQVQVDAA